MFGSILVITWQMVKLIDVTADSGALVEAVGGGAASLALDTHCLDGYCSAALTWCGQERNMMVTAWVPQLTHCALYI